MNEASTIRNILHLKPLWHASWIALALIALPGTAATVSDFNDGSQGWTAAGFLNVGGYPLFPTPSSTATVVYSATGGNPGGYISELDPDSNWEYFAAPASFLGNQSSAIGKNLTFDEVIVSSGLPPNVPQAPLVAITAGATTLVYGGGGATPVVSGNGWNSLSVSLDAAAWKVGTPTGATASTDLFNSVMSNVAGLYILSDYLTGFETVGLDNVSLPSAVPEPATAAIWLVGLGVLLLTWRRRARSRFT